MRHTYQQLRVWQKAREFVKDIYLATEALPGEEKFGLTSQIRRAAVSIPSNIAEGCGFNSDKQVNRFLEMAVSSSCELETQLFLSMDLGYIQSNKVEILQHELIELRRMMIGFRKSLNI